MSAHHRLFRWLPTAPTSTQLLNRSVLVLACSVAGFGAVTSGVVVVALIGVGCWGWALIHGVNGLWHLAFQRSIWRAQRRVAVAATVFNSIGLIVLGAGLVTVLRMLSNLPG